MESTTTACHAPCTSRIISLSAVNTEEEERQFSTINNICKGTSSRRPGHIIPNSIIRIQAEQTFRQRRSPVATQQSQIGKFATNLPDFPNTYIPHELLTSEVYQAHLEQISDFLLPGEWQWWNVDEESHCVIFHDSETESDFNPNGPPLHHFRSSSLKQEELYLKQKWEECLQTNIKLPIQKVKCYDCRGYLKNICYYNLFEDDHNFGDIDTDSAEESNCSHDNPEVPMPNVDHVNDETDSVQDEHEVQISLAHISPADESVDTSDDDNDDECNMFQQSQVFILHSLIFIF